MGRSWYLSLKFALGWTLVHEMYFYLVFAIFLALRIPILAGIIGWGVILLVIVATVPYQVMISPILRLATSPLTAEFMMGAIVGILWRKRCMSGVVAAGAVGLAGLMLSVVTSRQCCRLRRAHISTVGAL